MDDDQVPEGIRNALLEVQEQLRLAAPYLGQVQNAAKALEPLLPTIRQAQEFAEQASRVLEKTQPFLPLIQAMLQQQQLAKRILPTAGPLSVWADDLSRATDAGMAELAESYAAVQNRVTASLTVTPTFGSSPVQRTGRPSSLTIVPQMAAHEEVAAAEDDAAVPVQEHDSRSVDLAAVVVVLVWLCALGMPAAQLHLPQDAKDYLDNVWATIGLALIIQWRINDKREL
jgi:hypothetical protein